MTTTATTSIRTVVKQAIVAALQDSTDLRAVEVSYGPPPRGGERDALYVVSGPAGQVAIAGYGGASRLPRDDRFEVDVVVLARSHGRSALEAEQQVEQLGAPIEDLAALINQNPSARTWALDVAGLLTVEVSTIDGPHSAATDEGFIGYGTWTVSCHSRLS